MASPKISTPPLSTDEVVLEKSSGSAAKCSNSGTTTSNGDYQVSAETDSAVEKAPGFDGAVGATRKYSSPLQTVNILVNVNVNLAEGVLWAVSNRLACRIHELMRCRAGSFQLRCTCVEDVRGTRYRRSLGSRHSA